MDEGAPLGTGLCALCAREEELTFHHLIPRTLHGNRWFKARYSREELAQGVELCRDCHGAIHKLVPSEKELGREWSSLARLREHPQLMSFVEWLEGRSGRRPYRVAGGRRRR